MNRPYMSQKDSKFTKEHKKTVNGGRIKIVRLTLGKELKMIPLHCLKNTKSIRQLLKEETERAALAFSRKKADFYA